MKEYEAPPVVKTQGDERSFGGKTKDFVDKDEERKEQKHLKAYLAGKKYYTYGYTYPDGAAHGVPNWYKVIEVWK